MELMPQKIKTPEELSQKGAEKRREAFSKTEEERKEGVMDMHVKGSKLTNEMDILQAQMDRVKNAKERAEIYARLVELVEKKKKLNKTLKAVESENTSKVDNVIEPKEKDTLEKIAGQLTVQSELPAGDLLRQINKLFTSEGSGVDGRQKKIDLLGEIYGNDFVKANITEVGKNGAQKDIINDLLQQAVERIEERVDHEQHATEINKTREMLDRINSLFKSKGAGIDGRQKKIDLLGEIYGAAFVSENILNKQGTQDDNLNDLLSQAYDEIEGKLRRLESKKKDSKKEKNQSSQGESRKIIDEMRELKKRAKELEKDGSYDDADNGNTRKTARSEKDPTSGRGLNKDEDGNLLEGEGWSNRFGERNVGTRRGLESSEDNNDKEKQLFEALQETRKAFTRKDYETTGLIAKLSRSKIGNFFKMTPRELGDNQVLYAEYQQALNAYRDFKIEEMRQKYEKMTPNEREEKKNEMKKEMGDLAKEFGFDEKMELYAGRTDAMAAERKDKQWGKTLEVGKNLLGKYRKLGFKNQMLITVALLGGGAAAAATGFVFLAGAVGVLGVLRRLVGGASAGVGVVAAQETGRRWLEKRQSKKDIETFTAALENMDDLEAKFAALKDKCETEMSTFEKSYNDEKRKSVNRRLIGLGVGALVGSGAAASLGKLGFGKVAGLMGWDFGAAYWSWL